MMTAKPVSSGKLRGYYEQDDYYFQDHEVEIVGSGKETFGFSDTLNREQFAALVQQRQENNGGKGDHTRSAFDLTFSAPKSVSLLSSLGDDQARRDAHEAHDQAIRGVLSYIEESGLWRTQIKEEGKVRSEVASGMTAATIKHDTNRDMGPHLHTHCLLANVAIDQKGAVRCADYGAILRHGKELGQIYRSHLAQNLREHGYNIAWDKETGLFEVAGIESVKAKVSSRNNEIKSYREQNNVKDEDAFVRTRKDKITDRDQIYAHWDSLRDSVSFSETKMRRTENDQRTEINHADLYQRALDRLDETRGTWDIHHLHAAIAAEAGAAGEGITAETASKIAEKHLDNRAVEIQSGTYTTQKFLDLERTNLSRVTEQAGQHSRLVSDFESRLRDYQSVLQETRGYQLSKEQSQAVRTVLTHRDRLSVIQGVAGAGKTTAMECARVIAESSGTKVFGLATAAAAAQKLQQDSGIKSTTIASFLKQVESYEQAQGNTGKAFRVGRQSGLAVKEDKLLVIDEASFVTATDAAKILDAAERHGYRIALVGDTQQLQPVGTGRWFGQLQEQHGLVQVATLRENRRQKEEQYANATSALLHRGKEQEALEKLKEMGSVHEISTARDRTRAMAKETVDSILSGESAITVTSRNATKTKINDEVRFYLKQSGYLSQVDTIFKVQDARKRESEKGFVVGDQVICLKNDRKAGVLNGSIGKITNIQGDFVSLNIDNKDVTINMRKYNYIDHAYAVTTYKSQGQSVNKVIYEADSKSNLLTKNDFLVGITRGKQNISVYVDKYDKTSKQIKKEQKNRSALDIMKKSENNTKSDTDKAKESLNRLKDNPLHKRITNLLDSAKQRIQQERANREAKEAARKEQAAAEARAREAEAKAATERAAAQAAAEAANSYSYGPER